jgi:hypothetical protein
MHTGVNTTTAGRSIRLIQAYHDKTVMWQFETGIEVLAMSRPLLKKIRHHCLDLLDLLITHFSIRGIDPDPGLIG